MPRLRFFELLKLLTPVLISRSNWRNYLFLQGQQRELTSQLRDLESHASNLESQRNHLAIHASNLESQINHLEIHTSNLESQINHLAIHASNLDGQRNHLAIHASNLEKRIVALSRDSHFEIPQEPYVEPTTEKEFASLVNLLRILPSYNMFRRIGSDADGGYVTPLPTNISACFSAGVETNVDFEIEVASLGIKTYLIDFSVDGPPEQHDLFHFTKKALSKNTSQSREFISLDDWINEHEPVGSDVLVKIDIEGSEWGVLDGTSSDTLERIAVLIVEFHWFEAVKHKAGLLKATTILQKIMKHFDLVHAHPNNCANNLDMFGTTIPEVFEATFVRKSNNPLSDQSFSGIDLDADNCTNRPHIELAEYWFA